MDFNELFNASANSEKYRVPTLVKSDNSKIDDVVKNIEAEFNGVFTSPKESTSGFIERQKERQEIFQKLSTAETQLKKLKNPTGMKGSSTRRDQNTKVIAEQRDKIKKDIAKLKFQLEELDIEESHNKGNTSVGGESGVSNNNTNIDPRSHKIIKKNNTSPPVKNNDTKLSTENIRTNPIIPHWNNTNPYNDI
jgi:hypothetical protein